MKTQKCSALAALLLSVLSASAGQAIYKSIGRETVIGNGTISKITTKGFLVLDLDSANFRAAAVGGFTVNGQKLYSIVPLQNYRFVQVVGPNGTIYDVVAKAESPGTQFAGIVLESAFFQGKESSVIIDSTGPKYLPKVATSVGQSIAHNDSTGISSAGTSTGTAVLDVKGSLASNNAGESFDAAVNRLASTFASAGYTLYVPPPAN